MVASSGEALQSDAADVWDSGRVNSSETTHVRYGGAPLESFRRYFWTVTCWDDRETELRPLHPASFATGVLDGWAQDVQWISMADPTEYTSTRDPFIGKHHTEYFALYFRKEFQCDRPVAAAYAVVSAMGMCELRLNGSKVGDRVLDPAPTEFRNDTLYSCYDIGDQLRETNCVGAILGNGRCLKLYGYEQPAVLVLIHVAFTDGSTMTVPSDSTWTAAHGPIRENGIYFGEHYDARLEDNRWAVGGGGSDGWKLAKTVAGPMPHWQSMEPIQIDQDLRAQSISSPASGVYIYDFGRNISGFVRMSVRGPRGTTVTIRHAELLGDDGTLNTSTNRFAEATDMYILRGDGEEIFEPRFTYHGFRYAEITGYPGVPSDESLIARFVHSAVEQAGTFSCSNPLINQVHRNVIRGQLSNLVGIPTDCPQRAERQGWLGDIQLAVEEAVYNFNMAAFLKKYLGDIRTSQHEDGGLSSVVPEYWSIYPADPAWGTAYITLAWAVYWYYGDTQVLIDHYESLKRYVDYLDSVAEDGIIGNFSKLLFGDWCPPGSILPKRTPIELTSTWYYYNDTLVFSRIAGVLGHDDQQKKYADRAGVIKAAFNDRFLGERGYEVIKMGPWDLFPGQTSNLLPIYLNMVPDDRREQVLSRLLESVHEHQDDHLDTGIIGTRFLFDVLTDNGHGETAYRIATQDSYPGWGYMLREGATTLWERWEKLQGSGMNSQNHIMFGSVDAWFYRAIAGIRPTEAGWKRVEIRPRALGDLKYAAGSVETVRGTVAVSWERDGGSFRCRVSIPPGAKADVYLPVPDGGYEVTEGNAPIRDAARTAGDGVFIVEIESGDYMFEVKGTEEPG